MQARAQQGRSVQVESPGQALLRPGVERGGFRSPSVPAGAANEPSQRSSIRPRVLNTLEVPGRERFPCGGHLLAERSSKGPGL